MNVTLYVEGGGNDNQALQTECRRGFRTLLERATFKGRMPKIVACGSRQEAYDSFCTALAAAGPNDFPMLLVASEASRANAPKRWCILRQRIAFDKGVAKDSPWHRPLHGGTRWLAKPPP